MFKERFKTHHSAMSDKMQYLVGEKTVLQVLSQPNKSTENNATIYIHVPFCNKICTFCNMRRSLQTPTENYAQLIVKEIESYAQLEYIKTTVFDAVYFGGGTPTTLTGQQLAMIINALKTNFRFTDDAEFTIETTVTELDEEKMDTLVKAGANRFSVGVQTFDDAGRKQMNRIGSGEKAYRCLEKLKSYEGVTVSMDLIYNYHGQTTESLYADLDNIVKLGLDGFSMYSLINMKNASIQSAQDEKTDEMLFNAIADRMKIHGYCFIELTKMVTKDKYKYIMNRHQGADTLPLGAGAGGSVNGLAMMNPISLAQYEESVKSFGERKGMLFGGEQKEIAIFKGDIQTGILPRNEKLYKDKQAYITLRENLVANGMAEFIDGEYRLTQKGIFWGNTISRELSQLI